MATSNVLRRLPAVGALRRITCVQRQIIPSMRSFQSASRLWSVLASQQGITVSKSNRLFCTGDDYSSVLLRNGELAPVPWPSKGQLLRESGGAYTTARTVDQNEIFELSMHCQRLHDTALAILRRSPPEDSSVLTKIEALSVDDLKRLVCSEINASLAYIMMSMVGANDFDLDYQVTLMLTWDTVGPHTPPELGFDMYTFIQPLPFIDDMVDVEAHQATRDNPTIKDSQWVKDRQELEKKQRKAGVNEIVMFDADGNITEGLQTNFFAIDADGAIVTAPDDLVLAGTVRKVVLQAAEQNGISVRYQTPNVNDLDKWDSCFIGSTSRLVKPISMLAAPALELRREFPENDSVAHRIEELVNEAVRSNSETLES